MASNRVVVLGASAGGVTALQRIVTGLPRDFPAPILIVLHIGAHESTLPELLSQRGVLRATFGADGESVEPARIYVAPPNRHMLLHGERIALSDGPKENYTRPAIDPLFLSAALSRGPDVIGVVLTGRLDDGTAGLAAIKRCGGIAVVQDPADAQAPSMPMSALRDVDVDHKATLEEIPALLVSLAGAPCGASPSLAASDLSEYAELLRALIEPPRPGT